ncbi:MAG: hypothetical protein H6587_01880 [Flavobacteriales bacterium]|nr:hypothetical protein [Flavobacteriales bacterium]MCB9363295.1 hypothetical protein [Flavobacteriales bacterium]
MIKKDYIQRCLDELSKVLAVVLKLKQNNEPEKADLQLDEFGANFLSVNLNQFTENYNENSIEELISNHQFELTHFKILEELLYHKYSLNTDNLALKKITLDIMNYLSKTDKDFSFDRMNRINELK